MWETMFINWSSVERVEPKATGQSVHIYMTTITINKQYEDF